jgi:ankyrin repeat protein
MNGSTPLHHWHASGSFNGSVDIAQFLIEHGVDATAQDKRGLTPMNQASRCGNMYLARLLAEHATDRTVKAAPQIQYPATT